jgi:transcriptional regulator with XRE-family HTH domain
MSFKDNYIKLTEKLGGPYTLIKKGIKRSTITSIMDDSMPSVENAYKIAKALNVTMEELVIGKTMFEKKGKESRINESKERKERMEGRLYDIEGLNQERIDILQEMIDNWKVEDANKRKEERMKRASKSESKKSNSA